MKKKYIIIIGGAGFVGSNLIKILLEKTKFNLVSLDNYSTGLKKNHIKNRRVKYLNGHTKDIEKKLNTISKKINSLFHFGEFSRIYQSFIKLDDCIESNLIGSNAVFKFCMKYKIKLIYSATSASLGNKGKDKNLSPYAFTKAKNLEMLENLKKWYNLKFEIIYFYNVYGPNQISIGDMATVIGIFEDRYKKNLPLTVVKPGTQSRRFTHISDTVLVCYEAWKKNKCRHYSISSKESHRIIDVAKIFGKEIKYLPYRAGERYASSLLNMNLSNKVHKRFGKMNLKEYIFNFIKNHNEK
tara:strand:+ start:140 stop:1033 length:894 start_codon:yes stop_codon:yes gene_type:complete